MKVERRPSTTLDEIKRTIQRGRTMSVLERFSSEMAYMRGMLRTLRRVQPTIGTPSVTLPDRLEEICAQFADKIALVSDQETYTYAQFAARINRYARWAKDQGVAKGDAVALLMLNRADYLCAWLGIAKVGGVTALINTNLIGGALAHSIAISGAGLIIVESDLLAAYDAALHHLEAPPRLWLHGEGPSQHPRIDQALLALSEAPLTAAEKPALTIEDRCVFIYTSGTTGLPKAANINHYRVQAMALAFGSVMNVQPSDRIYDCLPMYHSNGGVLAPLGVLVNGGAAIIRRRFSAKEFWAEIVRFECTLFFYIGELCRYLVNSPPGPDDRRHAIRLICGNGLATGYLARLHRPLRHSRHSRVVCRHRGQYRAVQLRFAAGFGRSHPEMGGAALRRQSGPLRYRTRGAGSRAGRPLHRMRAQ
jgi:fatty-acyl-CoA synthase